MVSEIYLGVDFDGTYKILDNESQEIGKLEETRVGKGKTWTLFLNDGYGLGEEEIEEIIQMIRELKYSKRWNGESADVPSYVN